MAPELGHVTTGRTYVREKHTCESCKVRNRVGKPKPGEGMWAAWLHIDKHAMDVLLVAAAEFVELSEACLECQHKPHRTGMCGYAPLVDDDPNHRMPPCRCNEYAPTDDEANAVDFVDWVRPDAISKAWSSRVKVEPDPVTLEEKRRRHRAGAA